MDCCTSASTTAKDLLFSCNKQGEKPNAFDYHALTDSSKQSINNCCSEGSAIYLRKTVAQIFLDSALHAEPNMMIHW